MLAFASTASLRLSTPALRSPTYRPLASSSSTFLSPARAAVALPRTRAASSLPAMSLGKVVVAGGTGFVGTRLVRALVARGADVTVLTRARSSAGHLPAGVTARPWAPNKLIAVGDDWLGWQEALEGADLVVNLAGQPVVSRWSAAGKAAILGSRVDATTAIADAVAACTVKPRVVVSASAVGFYGSSEEATFDEGASKAKGDFLAEVSERWEAAAEGVKEAGVRLVKLRFGFVVGVGGGGMSMMLPFFKFGLGGPVGSGRQWMSWVHVDDIVEMIVKAGEDESVEGVYNATAPEPVTMGEFSKALAKALRRPNLLPVPGIALKVLLGDASSVVLQGQRVVPKKWEDEGFKFQYPDIDSCMEAVAKEA